MDEGLMRVADLTMGMPVILLGLVLVAAFGSSVPSLVLILGILFMPATARLARSSLLSELRADYHLAAISSQHLRVGRSSAKELLPNTMPVLLARASIVAAEAIFVEANFCGFVGLGVQPPSRVVGHAVPERARRTSTAPTGTRSSRASSSWLAVLALNTLGDNLQRVLDPGGGEARR